VTVFIDVIGLMLMLQVLYSITWHTEFTKAFVIQNVVLYCGTLLNVVSFTPIR
jgi:hypothetical protein